MITPIQVFKEYRKDISKQYQRAISPELRHARKVSDELEEIKIKSEQKTETQKRYIYRTVRFIYQLVRCIRLRTFDGV